MKKLIILSILMLTGCIPAQEQAHNAAVIQADQLCTGKIGKAYTKCYKAAMARLEPVPYNPQPVPHYYPVYQQPVYQAPVYQPYIQQPYVMQTHRTHQINCMSMPMGAGWNSTNCTSY